MSGDAVFLRHVRGYCRKINITIFGNITSKKEYLSIFCMDGIFSACNEELGHPVEVTKGKAGLKQKSLSWPESPQITVIVDFSYLSPAL